MTQESRLVITVDSRKAKTELDSVDKSLKSVETQGDKTAKKSKELGGAFKQAGDAAKSAKDGVSSFDGSLGGLTKTLGSSNALLSSAAIGIAGIAGAAVGSLGALTGMALAYANNAREIQNLATVADMGVVEFQRMAVAAQQVGITQEQLSDQIKDFNEKLGEFVLTGKGEATDAFELLQKNAKMSGEEIKKFALEMQKASGGDAMQMYVDKLEEAGVSQEQMSFLTENMANDFTKLLPIFADNGAAIDAWGDAAERAGAIMDEQAIAKAGELQVQSQLLELQLKGMSNTVLAAVVPALVDIADAFFEDSEQGNTFAQVGDVLALTLKLLASTAIVVGNAFYLVGDAIGAGAAAMQQFLSGDFSGAAQTVKDNYNNAVDSVANSMEKIDKIFTGKTSAKIKPLSAPPPSSSGGRSGVTTGLNEFAAGGKGKSKKETSGGGSYKSEANKRKREAEQLAREIARIEYEYSSAEQKRKLKLNDEVNKLQEKGMSEYIPLAKARYQEEEKLIQMKFEYDLVEHRLTEEQKLRFSMNIKEQEINADADLTKEQRKLKLDSLSDQFRQELSYIKLSREQRLFTSNKVFMSEMDAIKKRYELERQEIALIQDEKERAAALNSSYAQQNTEESGIRDQAISDYRGVMGFEENPLIQQFEVLDKMRELDLLNEEAYQNAKLQLQAKSTAGYMEGMLGGFASLVDENSKTYAVLFAAQKAFAVAQAMLNIPAAYSKAYDAVVGTPYIGPYIAPAVGAAAAALQVAQAASIKSTNMTGFKSGGYTGNYGVNQEAGVVHGQEYVLNAAATRRVGVDTLNAINNGGTIQAEKQAQANAKVGGTGQQSTPQNLQINNILDPSIVGDFMGTSSGTKTFMNFIKNNRSSIKAVIG
ncbi:phage tail tape measure protein [Acinetobacter johnsonii]|uniref:phage tail tape measure protein n=1 Tax=Acinetobacter johnsonii TaxID=40214 RepID=UPI00244C334E|nr:phage tail tape measure protein [Acinetobacter johnsonii]MDH1697769.1 phage tail tape measure protein [Acinetobacter johnsonii]